MLRNSQRFAETSDRSTEDSTAQPLACSRRHKISAVCLHLGQENQPFQSPGAGGARLALCTQPHVSVCPPHQCELPEGSNLACLLQRYVLTPRVRPGSLTDGLPVGAGSRGSSAAGYPVPCRLWYADSPEPSKPLFRGVPSGVLLPGRQRELENDGTHTSHASPANPRLHPTVTSSNKNLHTGSAGPQGVEPAAVFQPWPHLAHEGFSDTTCLSLPSLLTPGRRGAISACQWAT